MDSDNYLYCLFCLCFLFCNYYNQFIEFPLWQTSIIVFVLAWIGQFYGHKIEGVKPSFFEDLQFLMIWFGIFLVVVVEMAQITPPVGFNLFVLQGMAGKDMGYIARSAFPLFLLMILAVIFIIIFPEIALWLPEQMVQKIN